MKTPLYITTPIYYVNDIPHIGHVYTSIMADVIARFARLDGHPVFFLTGVDEHGQKVEKAAKNLGLSPQDFVNKMAVSFEKVMEDFNISNTDFIRTTQERHKKAVQTLWGAIEKNGFIYEGVYAGWYSVRDEAFYDEEELIEGKAPTGAPVEWIEETCYFFKLSQFQDQLLALYRSCPHFIAPETRRNEVIRFVEGGLQDLCISRRSFTWGISVPKTDKDVIYVWLDALTNYISGLGYPEDTPQLKTFWPHAFHLVGKDILRFHAVYWPAFLLAADLDPPQRIFAHGWWTVEGQKMSKSLGNVLDPYALINQYGIDSLRYFLVREVPFGQDGAFVHSHFIRRLNSDLANDLGNLCQRVLAFIAKNVQGKIPQCFELLSADEDLMDVSTTLIHKVRPLVLEDQALHRYCEEIWKVIALANQYVDQQAPWAAKKNNPQRMETILYVLCCVIKNIALLLLPIMPDSAAKILAQLGVDPELHHFSFLAERLKSGISLPSPEGLFPRIQESDS